MKAARVLCVFASAILFNKLCPTDATWWHRSGSTLAQIMACCLTVQSPFLNQCWFLSVRFRWHSNESNFTVGAPAAILYHELKIILLKLLPHLPGASEFNQKLNLLKISNLDVNMYITCIFQFISTSQIQTLSYFIAKSLRASKITIWQVVEVDDSHIFF